MEVIVNKVWSLGEIVEPTTRKGFAGADFLLTRRRHPSLTPTNAEAEGRTIRIRG